MKRPLAKYNSFFWSLAFAAVFLLAACSRPLPTLEETLERAESFLALGEFSSAIDLLEAFDEREPGHAVIVETLAEAYAGHGDFASASFNFIRLADMNPDDPLPLLFAASALREGGDHAGAVAIYDRYLRERPDDIATARAVAALHIERGNRSAAIDTLLRTNQAVPSGAIQVAIGRLFLDGRNLGQAQDWFASALRQQDETRPEALLGLLETALAANRPADAETLLRQMDAEFPGAFDRSSLAGQRRELVEWRRRQDEAREAAAALARARQRERETAPTVPAEPLPSPEVEVAVVPSPPPAEPDPAPVPATPRPTPTPAPPPPPGPSASAADRGIAALQRGDAAAAIPLFRDALRDDRENADLWMNLSEAQFLAGDFDWAMASASEAMRRQPNDVRPLMQFLRAAQQTLPPDRLIRELEQAKRRFPQSADITLALARGYARVGNNPRGARIFFNEFLALAPADHPERASAERELASL
ncbi:MAG: tetratricopeptide repeat protein [Opitutales bacterium]|nr:tetratricopeptide repeat protein [Opitutales bacterium]